MKLLDSARKLRLKLERDYAKLGIDFYEVNQFQHWFADLKWAVEKNDELASWKRRFKTFADVRVAKGGKLAELYREFLAELD